MKYHFHWSPLLIYVVGLKNFINWIFPVFSGDPQIFIRGPSLILMGDLQIYAFKIKLWIFQKKIGGSQVGFPPEFRVTDYVRK